MRELAFPFGIKVVLSNHDSNDVTMNMLIDSQPHAKTALIIKPNDVWPKNHIVDRLLVFVDEFDVIIGLALA